MVRSFTSSFLIVPLAVSAPLQAQTEWHQVDVKSEEKRHSVLWKFISDKETVNKTNIWTPLSKEESKLDPKQLVWKESTTDLNYSEHDSNETSNSHKKSKDIGKVVQPQINSFLWPNGQLMNEADQIYYRSAWSRGSMIQIGETVYPNLGFNALQRHPDSWFNAAIIAIDDSRIGRSDCVTGDFFDQCADGMVEARMRLWNSPALSFELHWTMHSLSGEGSPFNFTVGNQTFGSGDKGSKFGEGQSIGFVLSKNFGQTFGITFAGYRLFHFDKSTDLPRNLGIYGTKVFRLTDTIEPPIISLSAGLMTDVFNYKTNLGTVGYPDWLRGGRFPSRFAARFDDGREGSYYPDVAGVSSAFVCADKSIFAGKPITAVNGGCLQQVYLGPIASIGFAPWPWFGVYAKYSGTDVDLGISLKPFKQIPWTISLEALNPIKGINPVLDTSFDLKECKNKTNATFSDCRTRVGIFTELSF